MDGKRVWEAVVKSVYRVPTPITRSAVRASSSATAVPVWPMPPTSQGWSWGDLPAEGGESSEPLPAWVAATGMPVTSAKARSASSASLWWTPPPAISSGRRAPRTASAAAASASGSGTGRGTRQTRSAKNSSGQS